MEKILLITNRMMHYRVSIYNYFHKRFAENGYEFVVRSDEIQAQNTHPLKFDYETVELRFNEYRKQIQEINPSVIIIFLHLKDKMIWPLVHWLKWKKIPVAFWTKGLNLDAKDATLSRLLYCYMHKIADHMILYSKNEKKYISTKYHEKISVANNTVNFDDYPIIEDTKEHIKSEFGIQFKKIVLAVGRLAVGGGRKKINHLIKIFKSIEQSDVGLVIVGSGMTQQLKEKINKRNTLYLGEIHDNKNIQISKIFKIADIFSLPGHVGLGLNQAFYWGLPVVTEEGDQPPEINYLVNGRNGYIVPENDIDELKEKILYLLNNDKIRGEFSNNAKNDILKYGSTENMFQGFQQCIDALKM